MALVTVQRSPSPSNTPDSYGSDHGEGAYALEDTLISPRRSKSFSENYLAVKGAALILPQSECTRAVARTGPGGDIQHHLQSMFYLLRPTDTIQVAVKLECMSPERSRYMAVVSTMGRQDTDEAIILGIDIQEDKANVGLVLPIWGNMKINLDGDGGFIIISDHKEHVFKPVSVQAMWSGLQSLIRVRDYALEQNYIVNGLTHDWMTYYSARVTCDPVCLNEWHLMEDIESHRPSGIVEDDDAKVELETRIQIKLKEAMMTVDLEEVTSKMIRLKLEEELGMSLKDHRHFIDEQMIIIMRQMDSPSQIFDFLYLGSEWNASNLDELHKNGIGYILNVTREIDNFFPGLFEYYNVRVYDVEQSDLLKHWEHTFKFIARARDRGLKVLVHCKMGISRSASTVIAFAMKEFGWSLDQALEHVKKRRSCIKPNAGFMQQLTTYQGILDASKQRHSKLWRSVSTGNLLCGAGGDPCVLYAAPAVTSYEEADVDTARPRSWSPKDSTARLLLKTSTLATDGEYSSSDDSASSTSTTSLSSAAAITAGANDDDDGFQEMMVFPPWGADDVSSRSTTDSIDDPEPFGSNFKSAGVNVVLLSYRPGLDFSTIPEIDEHDPELEGTSESDGEVVTDVGKPDRGFYDRCMLAGYNDYLMDLQQVPRGEADQVEPDLDILHPDIKLEMMISQQRKKMRIARLLMLSQQKQQQQLAREEQEKVVSSRPRKRKKKRHHQHHLGDRVKTRPDDFWIKEIPPSPCEPRTEPLEDAEAFGDLLSPNDVVALLTSGVHEVDDIIPKDCVEETVDCDLGVEKATVDIPLDIGSPSKGKKEIGILQHYQREDIPWTEGTVKRTQQKFLASGSGSDTTPEQDSAAMERTMTLDLTAADGSDKAAAAASSGASTPVSTPRSKPTTPPEKHSPRSPNTKEMVRVLLDAQLSDEEGEAAAAAAVYEAEEIEPGIVSRTKREIEERERSKSFIVESSSTTFDLTKPVQRSSSWKNERTSPGSKRFDRNSERRKTCLPVLRATPDRGLSPSELSDDPGNTEVMFRLGGDDIDIEPGKVKRQTQGYESLDTGLLGIAPHRERSTSPFADEILEIPHGSVRKTTAEMEQKWDQATTKPQRSQSMVEYGSTAGLMAYDDVQTEGDVFDKAVVSASEENLHRALTDRQSENAQGENRSDRAGDHIGDSKPCSGGNSKAVESKEHSSISAAIAATLNQKGVSSPPRKKDVQVDRSPAAGSPKRIGRESDIRMPTAYGSPKRQIENLLPTITVESPERELASTAKCSAPQVQKPSASQTAVKKMNDEKVSASDSHSTRPSKVSERAAVFDSPVKRKGQEKLQFSGAQTSDAGKDGVKTTCSSHMCLTSNPETTISSIPSSLKDETKTVEMLLPSNVRSAESNVLPVVQKSNHDEVTAYKLIQESNANNAVDQSVRDEYRQGDKDKSQSGLKGPSIVKTVMRELESKSKQDAQSLIRKHSLGSRTDVIKKEEDCSMARTSSLKQKGSRGNEDLAAKVAGLDSGELGMDAEVKQRAATLPTDALSQTKFTSVREVVIIESEASKAKAEMTKSLKLQAVKANLDVDNVTEKNEEKLAVKNLCEVFEAKDTGMPLGADGSKKTKDNVQKAEEKSVPLHISNLKSVPCSGGGADQIPSQPLSSDQDVTKVDSAPCISPSKCSKLGLHSKSPFANIADDLTRPRSQSALETASASSSSSERRSGVKIRRVKSSRSPEQTISHTVRKLHGKSHPLAKLAGQEERAAARTKNPVYNTM